MNDMMDAALSLENNPSIRGAPLPPKINHERTKIGILCLIQLERPYHILAIYKFSVIVSLRQQSDCSSPRSVLAT
jgi:hypothetical protein